MAATSQKRLWSWTERAKGAKRLAAELVSRRGEGSEGVEGVGESGETERGGGADRCGFIGREEASAELGAM